MSVDLYLSMYMPSRTDDQRHIRNNAREASGSD